jgi:hypothetical protein
VYGLGRGGNGMGWGIVGYTGTNGVPASDHRAGFSVDFQKARGVSAV